MAKHSLDITTDRDPEGARLPVRIDTTSNGEFEPVPLEKRNIAANALAHEWVSENARRTGASRRNFLVSACGAATTLLAVNHANAMVTYKISLAEAKQRASRDALSDRKDAYRERLNPSFATYGPKNRREFLALKSLGG